MERTQGLSRQKVCRGTSTDFGHDAFGVPLKMLKIELPKMQSLGNKITGEAPEVAAMNANAASMCPVSVVCHASRTE